MKLLPLFSLLLFFSIHLQAQYKPFFTEDFSSNAHHWKESAKKPFIAVSSNSYLMFNETGKQPLVSLIEIPFNDSKIYRIETWLKQGYTTEPDGGQFGVFFNAGDEKNGYAFVLHRYSQFKLLKFTNGKAAELAKGSCSINNSRGTWYNGDKVSIQLEKLFWKFFVNDTFVYSCLSYPWMGHKTGFYVAAMTDMDMPEGLRIFEAEPDVDLCPLPFSQEELNEQLGKIICAAPDDFMDMKGDLDFEKDDYSYWNPKNISVAGAQDMVLSKDNTGESLKKGMDFVVMFNCPVLTEYEPAMLFFDRFRTAINKMNPSCVVLKQNEVKEDLADFLPKSVTWEGVVNSPTAGKLNLKVELDLNRFDDKFYNNVHVNILK